MIHHSICQYARSGQLLKIRLAVAWRYSITVMERRVISYLAGRRVTIANFVIISGSVVGINLLLRLLMVRYLGFSTAFLENVANAVSMEISI